MVDRLSKAERSQNMSRIKSRNTRPEMVVRSLLHRLGYRFRLHNRHLPGSPDIVLPRHQTAVFVHGCFWHRHSSCKLAYTPKSRVEFWNEKFEQNVLRDKRAMKALSAGDWKVIVVWECQIRDLSKLERRLLKALKN